MRRTKVLLCLIVFSAGIRAGFAAQTIDSKLVQDAIAQKLRFAPLPKIAENPANPVTPAKVTLGKMLYFDKRLSKNQDISCNSCHLLDAFGVDHEPVSEGHKKQLGNRNSPTVYNAALHFRQFWDGREPDVEAQALGPILNPVEMAIPSEEYALKVIGSIAEYQQRFRAAFPGEKKSLTYKNIGKAIGAFERTLLTPSRFDQFLQGNDTALSEMELKGLVTFATLGCTTCHNGVAIGGGSFQKLGLMKPFKTKDLGRYEVTKADADKFFFKPPSLRNVTKTPPYFHDGSVKTLDEAIKLMGKHQLGIKVTKGQIEEIKAFFGSLTGEIPKEALIEVRLPPSSVQTPKPDPN